MTDLRPVVGDSLNTWGTKFLDWLSVSINDDGTLNGSQVQAALGGSISAIGGLTIADMPPSNAAPWYIAHRGMPCLLPECSLEGFVAAVAAGVKVIELPFFVLADGSTGVMHDTTIDRTTSSSGNTADQTAASWQTLVLDCYSSGSGWLPQFPRDLHPPTLDEVLQAVAGRCIVILEGKNAGSGAAAYAALKRHGMLKSAIFHTTEGLWTTEYPAFAGSGVPLSFQPNSTSTTPATILASGATYVATDYDNTGESSTYFTSLVNAGLNVLPAMGSGQGYGRRSLRDGLLALGVVGLACEDPLYTGEIAPAMKSDKFAGNIWLPGMIPSSAPSAVGDSDATTPLPGSATRGQFVSGRFAFQVVSSDVWTLQGWLGALNKLSGGTYTLTWQPTYDQLTNNPADTTRWPGVGFGCPTDAKFLDNSGNGYDVILRESGALALFKVVNGASTQLGATISTTALTASSQATVTIAVTPAGITVTRTDVGGFTAIMTADTTFGSQVYPNGGYVHLGKNDSSKGGHYSNNLSVSY